MANGFAGECEHLGGSNPKGTLNVLVAEAGLTPGVAFLETVETSSFIEVYPMEKKWKFELKQQVKLIESDEKGTVIGRCEYASNPDSYYVRYLAGDGRQTTAWWEEDHLVAI